MARDLDPSAAAKRVGAEWSEADGALELPFLGGSARITHPAYEVTLGPGPAPPHVAALLVYHLAISDGTAPSGEWISFGDLPEASFYVQTFRGYTGAAISSNFGPEGARLDEAAARLGGRPLAGMGDRAWRIPALPRVPIALLWWNACEEFGARAELLFDETAAHHMTTDGCAVLGSWTTGMLKRAAEAT
jgi:hypothetical protein